MNLVDIAIFKHYIGCRHIREQFIKNYNHSKKFAGNPQEIESYFSNVEWKDVISKAIKTFVPNSAFGCDFWQDINRDWIYFYKRNIETNGAVKSKDGLDKLNGYFKALRENWDCDKPWRYEEEDVALKRLGLLTEESNEVEAVEDATIEDPFDDLEFVDLSDSLGNKSTRLKANEGSVNLRNKGYRFLVAQNISELLRGNKMLYCRLATSKSGDLVVQFNKNTDNKSFVAIADSCLDKKRNISVNSKLIALYIKQFFNCNEDYFIVSLEQTHITDNFVNYKITKK